MAEGSTLEVRLELFPDRDFPIALAASITAMLTQRWPEQWDVKIPPRPTREHPAEWRAVVPLPDGATPESLHGQIEQQILGLDPGRALHFRTRWAFAESPDHQEVYEVRWA